MTPRRLTLLTALGSGLEYYDFVVYAFASSYLSTTFFPVNHKGFALLQTLLIFAIGYLVRPIGGMIFGSIGDRFGRKQSFTFAILLMAIATISIALLPSYSYWGLWSPCLLILFRFAQGLSQGAELPGALTFIVEHTESNNRGLKTGIMFMGVGFGSMLASGVFYLLNLVFNPVQMQNFGWRIAFAIGGLAAVLGFLLRRQASETPLFLNQTLREGHRPLREVLSTHRGEIFLGIGFTLFPGSLIIYFLFLPSFIQQFYHYQPATVLLLCTLSMAISAAGQPLSGWLSDRLGRRFFLQISAAIMIVGNPLLFYLLSLENTVALILVIMLYQAVMTIMAACYPTLIAELFPTSIRYSGTALTYNISFALAGCCPLLIAHLLQHYPDPSTVVVFFSLLAALSFISICYYPIDRNKAC